MLLLTNISQLVTLKGDNSRPRRGKQLSDIGLISDAAVLIGGGQIIAAGKQQEMLRHPWFKKNKRKLREIDCQSKTVLPGFVDSHTHLVFAEPRLIDFEKRIAGATYQEIAAAGGGIRSSVTAVRKASKTRLAELALEHLHRMLAHGTTTVEAKSGYGLSLESEIKSLEAIRAASKRWPGTVAATLLGAHVVPDEYKGKAQQYVREVCDSMITAAAKKKLAEFTDVFCEPSAFSLDDTVRIFEASRNHGLVPRAHVGQFTACTLDGLLRHKPASLDHMDVIDEGEINRLAASPTVATLLPAANYFLGHRQYPDARKLIDSGVAIALATDFNPGTSPTPSMPFVLSLACTQMRMTPAEAVAVATINGAHALLRAERKGSIEEGKDADLAIFDCSDYREVAYWFAENRCESVIVGGEEVHTKDTKTAR